MAAIAKAKKVAAEVERLRAENARLRAEVEQLRAGQASEPETGGQPPARPAKRAAAGKTHQ